MGLPRLPDGIRALAGGETADVARVVSGNLARNVLRGLFKLLLAAVLAPQAMGILRAVTALFKMTTSLLEFGLDNTLVSFVSRAIKQRDEIEQKYVLGTVLGIKCATALGVIVVGNLLAEPITRWVFADPSLTIYTRLVSVAVGGQLLWRYLNSFLGAQQRFGRLAFFLTTVPALMLTSGLVALAMGRLDVQVAIAITLFAPAVTVVLWWTAVGPGLARLPALHGPTFGRVSRFSRWLYASSVASSTRGHLNPLLLKNPALSGTLRAGETQAGLYGFGSDLANEITVLSQSLLTILLPKASSKTTPDKLRRFVKKAYGYIALSLIPLIGAAFLAKPLLLLLGRFWANYLEYLPSLPIFAILYGSALFSIASMPMQSALYAMRKPHLETTIELVTIPLLIGGALVLIPLHGGVGAALAVAAQRFAAFLLYIAFGVTHLRRVESLE